MAHESPRREELLEATARYLLANGVSDVSLRPLAAAIGTKARLLIYHFGSRDALVSAALSLVLRRVQEGFVAMEREATLRQALLAFWDWATAPESAPYVRLVFEVHGRAPYDRELYGGYVREALDSWRDLVVARLGRRLPPKKREAAATTLIAVVDGLLLDYLATGDRERTTGALRSFLRDFAPIQEETP